MAELGMKYYIALVLHSSTTENNPAFFLQYLSVYSQGSHITPNFKKMIEMVGTHLSQQVYSLISYIQLQSMQAAEQQQERGKKGGREGEGYSFE